MFEFQNNKVANILSTPSHIRPEWYFMGAYTCLRSLERKVGGVCLMLLFILLPWLLPLLMCQNKSRVVGCVNRLEMQLLF